MKKKNMGAKFNKYPNGYLPKIQYWTEQLTKFTNEGDKLGAKKALNSLKYFMDKQNDYLEKKIDAAIKEAASPKSFEFDPNSVCTLRILD